MSKFNYQLFGDQHGKLSGVFFSRNKAGKYVRSNVRSLRVSSDLQVQIRQRYKQACDTWFSFSYSDKRYWSAQAFKHSFKYSGFNYFIKIFLEGKYMTKVSWGEIEGNIDMQIDLLNKFNNIDIDMQTLEDEILLKQNILGFTPENLINKSSDVNLGSSDIIYPTQNAVKSYVDSKISSYPVKMFHTNLTKDYLVSIKNTNVALYTAPAGKHIMHLRYAAKFNGTGTNNSTGNALIKMGSDLSGGFNFSLGTAFSFMLGTYDFSSTSLDWSKYSIFIQSTFVPAAGFNSIDLYLFFLEFAY